MITAKLEEGVTQVTYNNPDDLNDPRTDQIGTVHTIFSDKCIRVKFKQHGKDVIFGCDIKHLSEVVSDTKVLPSIKISHANKAVLQIIIDKVKTMKGIGIETTGF